MKKVLIVDDEPNILLSLEFIVQKSGYSVATAQDGEAALEKIKDWSPDLVLLDINMPKLDGFEVCQLLREDSRWNALKIIMLTAKGRQVEREKGLALGADDYITKPFSTQDVINKISVLLS
ncbi:MAG: response regulator [Gammaproteobacteria bacterium]|nr:response regulator [Gammaproteobacteria bacterium]